MEEEVTYRGEWWIPGNERRWPGRFSYTREHGVRVEVVAGLEDELFPVPPDPLAILFGQTADRTAMTLVEPWQVQTLTHLPGNVEITFAPNLTFIGAWFESREDLVFDRLSMRLSGVERWLDISGFNFDYRSPQEGFSLDYEPPDSVLVARTGDAEIHADFSARGPSLAHPLTDIAIHQRAWLRLAGNEPRHFDELSETADQLRNFFSFVMRRPVRLLEMSGRAEVDAYHADGRVERRPKEITILYKPGPDSGATKVEQFDMLFLYDQATANSDNPLSAWLGKRELLGPIYDLYLIAFYEPSTYLHLQFLSLAQALESLHGRKFPDYELPKNEHQARLEEILASTPGEHETWLREKLAHSNQAQFRKKILDLVQTMPPSIKSAIGDPDTFAQLVGWTRNYYTHWDTRLEEKAAKDGALMRLTTALKVIAEALLLLEIGLAIDEVEFIATQNRKVRRDIDFALRSPAQE